MFVIAISRRHLVALLGVSVAAVAACSSATSMPPSDAGSAQDSGSTKDAGAATVEAGAGCNGRAALCPYKNPPNAPSGHSDPIVDPASCGVLPFGVDAGTGTTCAAFCASENSADRPQMPNTDCVTSDAGPGAFTCECFLIP